MPITISVADVRRLLNANQPEAVLYVELDEETGKPAKVDLWVNAYVSNHRIITSRADLVDWLGEDITDEGIAEYLEELQQTVDGVVERASA